MKWSTISVPVLTRATRLDSEMIDEARNQARDVIAVLRVFQRVRAGRSDIERQTFGVATDVGSTIEPRWITDTDARFAGTGWQAHGVLAEWSFRDADFRAYRADARFQFLDAALRQQGSRNDWQERAIVAARTKNLATVMQRPSTRIVLLATALEALLGEPYVPGGRPAGGHLLAKRMAYLYCGTTIRPPEPHGINGRLACGFLTSATDPRSDPQLHDKRTRTWACSWYAHMRTLYDNRNEAVHGASSRFDQRAASEYEWHFDHGYLAVLDWVTRTNPTSIADLDAEIAALPAA
jgi:hypothetical protein